MLFRSQQRFPDIRQAAARFRDFTDEQLKAESLQRKYGAMQGQILADFDQKCALVAEAVRRLLGKDFYDVQLQAGREMVRGRICEMKTGEGKTLTATIPAYLFGLTGRGCHVVTVNDYLAARDLELLKPVYAALGLSSGAVLADQTPQERVAQYRCDITYGTAKEFGFDFLRDRLHARSAHPRRHPTQRELHAVLIDEADSILLDEARTPLIIGAVDPFESQRTGAYYQWAAEHASDFQEATDFTFDPQTRSVELTTAGFQKMGSLVQTEASRQASTLELMQYLERAILVRRNFRLDKNYTIHEGEVVIVDEYTGRPTAGRKWQAGIHQSIEAREGLPVTPKTEAAASATMQHFFRLYQYMAGMTGTAFSARQELRHVYRKRVVRIPTHRPVQRRALPPRVFADTASKFAAVAAEIRELLTCGRAVLIGTRSVYRSEQLAELLTQHGVAHRVLNARQLQQEAEIVRRAGQPQAVTVATNMAGRGTDIQLHPAVQQAGGLHVVVTELHESPRIDWQLIGRCSRQGDPGSYRIFVSLEDEILALGFGEAAAERFRRRTTPQANSQGELPNRLIRRFRRAQRLTERRHATDRLVLLRQEKDMGERMVHAGQDIFLDLIR